MSEWEREREREREREGGVSYKVHTGNHNLKKKFVYQGCPTPGRYGADCSLPCPENCKSGFCDIVEGSCLGCIDGYTGTLCDKGTYKSYSLRYILVLN